MIEVGAAMEDEMIAAFLRAEIESSRFSGPVKGLLAQLGLDRALLDSPNTRNSDDNRVRRRILGAYRGYPDRALFAGFPSDTIWRRVQLEPSDFATLRYLNDESRGDQLLRLSGGTRRVTDGARNFSRGLSNEATAHINPIVIALRNQGWRQFHTARKEMLDAYDNAKQKAKIHEIEVYQGKVAEAEFRKWLTNFLPKRFGVTPGYIVSQRRKSDQKTPHFDVIIYDALNSPVLWVEDNFDASSPGQSRAIPAEHVLGVLEV
jgi:hypothetical protein